MDHSQRSRQRTGSRIKETRFLFVRGKESVSRAGTSLVAESLDILKKSANNDLGDKAARDDIIDAAALAVYGLIGLSE